MTIDTNLHRLQREVGEWSTENFGEDQPAKYPLLGAGEELGELSTSVLKRAQGIDGSAKYDDRDDVGPDAERDAVGDVVIYLCDFVYRRQSDGMGLNQAVDLPQRGTKYVDDRVSSVLQAYVQYGMLVQTLRDRSVGNVIMALDEFCRVSGYDTDTCIQDAWEEVSGRTWDASVESR